MVYAHKDQTKENHTWLISRDDVYWIKRSGARVLICRAGDLIDHESIARFENIERVCKVDLQKLQTIFQEISQLQNSARARERMKITNNIRSNWETWFLSSQKLSVLELVVLADMLMHESLKLHVDVWAKASMPLFHRSSVVGLVAMFGAIALGYNSWSYLEQIWQVSFSHSVSFALNGMTEKTIQCLEHARIYKRNSGIDVKASSESFPSLQNVYELSQYEQAALSQLTDMERWYRHIQANTPWGLELSIELQPWWDRFFEQDNFRVTNKVCDFEKTFQEESAYRDFEL